MYTSNNQVIFEEIYDENIQPTEEEIIEYANFLGIDAQDEAELMWIARQGVMAPLPRGWKPVQDPQGELYYFNFETGESIWDHPCDQDFKKLVIEERKVLLEKGKEAYKLERSVSRQGSPTKDRRSPALGTLKQQDSTPLLNGISTMKSTSSISDLIGTNKNLKSSLKNMRSDFGMFDSRELGAVEFEEEKSRLNGHNEDDEEDEEDEESEPSWQKKSGSDDSSDSFRKPVDFGIDKDISTKLDKLNLMLMVGKEPEKNQHPPDSAPTTSRDMLDSTGRAYARGVLGLRDEDLDLKKSVDSTMKKSVEFKSEKDKSEPEHQKDLKSFQDSLNREFDQKRLELLEEKDDKIVKLREDIEQDLLRMSELEKKRIIKEQDERLKELRDKLQADLERERDVLKKKQVEVLGNIQKEFENERQLKKQKCSMQISKFMDSGQSLEKMDENEEKREIAIYFEHIEKKYSERLDEKKKLLEMKYEKLTRDLEAELEAAHKSQTEKKEDELKAIKEKNMHLESYDNKMEAILKDKVNELKEKETQELSTIKQEYDIKVKAYKDKYKDLEQKDFNYLENEYNQRKEQMQQEHNRAIGELEKKLKAVKARQEREEEDLKKRLSVIEERRRVFGKEWEKLNEDEKKLNEKKEMIYSQAASTSEKLSDLNAIESSSVRYEVEKLRLENANLVAKVENMQKMMDKFYNESRMSANNTTNNNKLNDSLAQDTLTQEHETEVTKGVGESVENDLSDMERENDDVEIQNLIRQAKQKLKIKYMNHSKKNPLDSSEEQESSSTDNLPDISADENESLEDNILYDHEDQSTIKSSRRDNFSNSLSHKYKKSFRSQENLLVSIDHKNFLYNNLNKERELILLANELLNKFGLAFEKRKMKLESVKINLSTDMKYKSTKLTSKQEQEYEERQINIDREGMELEELALKIKTARRLIKQKKKQLNLIEFNIFDKSSSMENFQDMIRPATMTTRNLRSSFTSLNELYDDSNLNELLYKMNSVLENESIGEAHKKKLQTMLKTIAKVDAKLRSTFKHLSRMNGKEIGGDGEGQRNAEALNFIHDKWQSYLNQGQHFSTSNKSYDNMKKFMSRTNVGGDSSGHMLKQSGPWENLAAYHKLTFDAGTNMLEDKWHQYIGESSPLAMNDTGSKGSPFSLSKKLQKSNTYNLNHSGYGSILGGLAKNNTSSSLLPSGTQQRLNQHREWLKKFRANSDFKNSSIFF